jgi:hypothetical protein
MYSSSLVSLLICFGGFLPHAVLADFLPNLISVNIPSRNCRNARSHRRSRPRLPSRQCVCGPMPSAVNLQDLALPERRRCLPAGPLIPSFPFSEQTSVKQLQKVAGVRG